jgi:hypothetical protein
LKNVVYLGAKESPFSDGAGSRVARWFVRIPKVQNSVGGPRDGKGWYIYVMAGWYILQPLGIFYAFGTYVHTVGNLV